MPHAKHPSGYDEALHSTSCAVGSKNLSAEFRVRIPTTVENSPNWGGSTWQTRPIPHPSRCSVFPEGMARSILAGGLSVHRQSLGQGHTGN